MSGRLTDFLINFGKPPTEPPREWIPKRWRMPVFLSMVVVGIVGLTLIIVLWFSPATRTQTPGQVPVPSATVQRPATTAPGASQ